MEIEIKLTASLRLQRFKSKVGEFPTGTTVNQVVSETGIPNKEIGIILINGQHASLECSLQDGDTLTLLPLMGGG